MSVRIPFCNFAAIINPPKTLGTMKKVFLVMMMAATVACSTQQKKNDPGKENVCQFVREQVPELREDIASVDVIAEDSLLSDVGLMFASSELLRMSSAYLKEEVSKQEFQALIDSIAHEVTEVGYSWQFGKVANDSLRKLEKYGGIWRKVYTVRVTMKSGTTKELRVMMDDDGITPRMMERDMKETLDNIGREVMDAQRTARTY